MSDRSAASIFTRSFIQFLPDRFVTGLLLFQGSGPGFPIITAVGNLLFKVGVFLPKGPDLLVQSLFRLNVLLPRIPNETICLIDNFSAQ